MGTILNWARDNEGKISVSAFALPIAVKRATQTLKAEAVTICHRYKISTESPQKLGFWLA